MAKIWRKGQDSNLQASARGSFRDYCLTKLGYPSELVHVVGLAPTKSQWTPDLQSGAFAAQPHMQKEIDLCYKTDEGREEQSREHTSRHTSPEDGELADSRKAPSSSSGRRLPAFIPQKGISIVKKLKERD